MTASPADNPSDWYCLPTLSGELVRLEPLRLEDTGGYLRAARADSGHDAVFQWLVQHPPLTEGDAREQIVAALAARARGERLAYAQFDAATGAFIGTTSLYDVVPTVRTLAIGHTWLGTPWWRTGHNTEAKLLLLTYAFDELGAARVVWHTDVHNVRSQAAIARLGATHEGVLRKHRIRRDGSWRDTVQYSMTDDDWPIARDRLRERLQAGGRP